MDFDVFDDIDDGQAGGFQNMKETGVVDVELRRIGLVVNKTGSISISITVNGGGEFDNTYYCGVIKKTDGTPGWENGKLLQPLRLLAGLTALPVVKETIKTKNGTKEIDVFDGFKGLKCKLALQNQFNDYNGKFDTKIVKAFNTDGRTAAEIKEGVSIPEQIKYFMSEKFKDKGAKGSKPKAAGSKAEFDVDVDDVF